MMISGYVLNRKYLTWYDSLLYLNLTDIKHLILKGKSEYRCLIKFNNVKSNLTIPGLHVFPILELSISTCTSTFN